MICRIPVSSHFRLFERLPVLSSVDSRASSANDLVIRCRDASSWDWSRPSVGIVGTRRPTGYGLRFTREVVSALAPYGWNIVSGGAFGIDVEAHVAALERGLPTQAFVVGPSEAPSPRAHEKLFEALERTPGCALVTPSTLERDLRRRENPPRKWDWICRNAWLVGACDALIVVEGLKPSGTWSSVEVARDYDIPVFALPGPIFSPQSEATNQMISIGSAVPILSVEDLVQSLVVRFGATSYNKFRSSFGDGIGPEGHHRGGVATDLNASKRYPRLDCKILNFLTKKVENSAGIEILEVLGEGTRRGFSNQELLEAVQVLEEAGEFRVIGQRLERRGSL